MSQSSATAALHTPRPSTDRHPVLTHTLAALKPFQLYVAFRAEPDGIETWMGPDDLASPVSGPLKELTGRFTVTFKLDWLFVKPASLTDPDDRDASYTFAPRFGRTLKALNYSLKDRISDHSPIYADLP